MDDQQINRLIHRIDNTINTGCGYGNSSNFVSGAAAVITDNTAHDVIAAPGSGNIIYITSILVTNSHATTGTLVTIQDDANTVIWQGYAASAGGGFSFNSNTPIKMPVANKKLQAICGTSGASVYVCISGYKGI